MGCQKLEDFNLLGSEVEPAAIEPDVIIIDIYFKIAMLYDLGRFFSSMVKRLRTALTLATTSRVLNGLTI